ATADRQAPRLQEKRAEIGRIVIADARRADRGMCAADRLQDFEHELRDLGAVDLQARAILEFGLARCLGFERLEEGGFERIDFDPGARDLVLHPGIAIGAGVTSRLPQAMERAQRMDRRARADALFREQRRADRPAFPDLAEDVADRHNDIVEEYLAEFVI